MLSLSVISCPEGGKMARKQIRMSEVEILTKFYWDNASWIKLPNPKGYIIEGEAFNALKVSPGVDQYDYLAIFDDTEVEIGD
jgi:hypothetical protein